MRKLFRRFGLGVVLVVAVAGLAVQSAAGHPVDHPWTGAGDGSTNVVSDGTSGPAVFSYSLFGNPCCGVPAGNWTFSTVASSTGTVNLKWKYEGYNAYYEVIVGLDAYVTHAATTTTTPLVHDGPVNCCTPPSGGFSYTGTVSLSVQAGDTYVFAMYGHNYDSDAQLTGTLTVDDPDVTPPAITIASPGNGDSYTLGSSVPADYSCLDSGGSGLASCAGPVSSGAAIDTSTVGPHSFTVNAADNAGNTSSATNNYSVLYNFAGFFQPVDNLPIVNSVKAGSAVPVKFSLRGNQGLSIFAVGYPKSEQITCDSTASVDGIEETVTAGGSSLSYDSATDTYNYVWKTDKAWAGTCRQLVVKLNDGAIHRANFKLTK